MNNKAIGVLDSGIGGLTVLKELKRRMPNESYVYLGDTKNFPYGEKSKDEIIEYTRENIKLLVNQDIKAIVIACGTATSQALDIVSKENDVPIFGIIKPTARYVSNLNLEKVGVIATTGTIRSNAWEIEIKKQNPNLKVINKACPLLASIAEEGKIRTKESLDAIHEYMQVFKNEDVDTIILGCTHYPIYNEIIRNEFTYEINLINTGIPVSNELENYLDNNNLKSEKRHKEDKLILTKVTDDFKEKARNILNN